MAVVGTRSLSSGAHSRDPLALPTLQLLGRRFPPIEPLGIDDALLLDIIERLIKRLHLGVVGPHHKLQFFDAERPQPVFRGIHDYAAVPLVTTIGIDRDVIDPAAMAVMSDQG